MSIDPAIFKSYDIRAIYPTQINEENIKIIVQAIYEVVSKKINKDKFRMLISRDMRVSSPSLFQSAKEALLSCGIEVIDIGLSSTPTFYYAVYSGGYEGGFQISASHNPKEWNGLKIVINSPNGLIKVGKTTGMDDVKDLSLNKSGLINKQGGKLITKTGILEAEVINALRIAGNPEINSYKIVADAANSMGATYLDELFKHIPGNFVRMNFNLDGTFPAHQPNPLDFDTLKGLQNKIIEEKADMGFAPDGDGDRFFFIDEKAQVVPPSIITSLVARELLKNNKGATILFDIRYILTPKKIIEENGGKWDITKVGHAYITEKMHETGAIFAGESSSHFFFKETGNGEAPLPVALIVLSVMTREGKKLSELAEELRRSYESGEFNFKVTNAKEILDSLKEKYKDGVLSELDGVAVSYPDWRFSVRTSNTEPLLRLNVEALEKDTMRKNYNEIKEYINTIAKHD